MFGLIYENFLILKKQILMASLLLIFSLIPSIMYSDYIFMIFSTILVSMLPITACVYENESKMIKVLLSMPIDRKTFVISKYLSTFILCGIGFIMNFIYYLVRQQNFILSLALSLACFIIGTTLMNVMFPLVFKYGVEKAKFLLICIMIGLASIIGIIYKIVGFNIMIIPKEMFTYIGFGIFCIYILIYMISISTSVRSYKKIDII